MTKRTGEVSLAEWDIPSIDEVANKAKDELSQMLQSQMDASLQLSIEVGADTVPRIHASLPFGADSGTNNWVIWKVNLRDALREVAYEGRGTGPYKETEIDALIDVLRETLGELDKTKQKFMAQRDEG